jgi:hypothetical protein
MDREGGFIVIHRRILSSPVYQSLSAEQRSVFLTLLLLANWKDNPVLINGSWEVIKRGELFYSLSEIAKRAGVGIRVVRTTIKRLTADDSKIGGNGPVLTTRRLLQKSDTAADKAADKAPRVITIRNYSRYQDVGGSADTAADTAADTSPTQARHKPDTSPTPIEQGKPVEPVEPVEPPTSRASAGSAQRSLLDKSEQGESKVKSARHKATVDLWCRLWSELRGGTYRVSGAKDGSAVKRLLTYPEATDAEIEKRIRHAFTDQWFRSNGTLAVFVSRWSALEKPSVDIQPELKRHPEIWRKLKPGEDIYADPYGEDA